MWLLVIIAVLLVLTTFIKSCDTHSIYLTWKYPKLTSFTYVPFLGHLGFLKYSYMRMKDIYDFVERTCAESPKMVYCLGLKMVTVYKPEHLEVILTHPNTQDKPYLYNFMDPVIGNSLLCLNGHAWRTRRKLMNPLMQHGVIGSFVDDVNANAEKLAEQFSSRAGKMFDASIKIAKNNLDMFINVIMGVDNSDDRKDAFYSIHTITSCVMLRILAVPKHLNFIYNLTKEGKLVHHAEELGNKIMRNFFYKRKEDYQRITANDAAIDDNRTGRRMIIEHLIKLKLPETDILNELNLFLVAGFETTAFAISMALISMAMNPDIQEKVYNEVMEIIGADRSVSHNDISRFVYMKKVIHETLRLYPSVTNVGRITTGEVEIDGHLIPKNTQVILSILTAHRSPLYWPDPMKFDPERFNDDAVKQRHRYSFIPFLAGTRNCFGLTFAMMNMTIVLAILVRKFKFYTSYKSPEEIELELSITTKCVKGVPLRAELRKT